MDDLKGQLIQISSTLHSLTSRFESAEIRQESRHVENTKRIDRAVEKFSAVLHEHSTRLSVIEAIQDTFKVELDKVRERYHQLGSWLQTQVSVSGSKVEFSSDDRPVSRVELKWLVALGIGALTAGASVTVWVLKMAGKL